MTAATTRRRIGTSRDLASRQAIYLTSYGLEVDESDHFTIRRRRLFFEDIVLVTKHHYVGAGFMIAMAATAMILLVIGFAIGETPAVITFSIMAAPFIVAAVLRGAAGVEVITVFGKRSKARMLYRFRKARARAVLAEITAKTREAQRRLADAIRESTPPESAFVETLPMPPNDGDLQDSDR